MRYQAVTKPKHPAPFKAAAPATVSTGTKPKSKQKPSGGLTSTQEKNKRQKSVNPLATIASRSSSGSQPCELSGDSNPFPPVFKTNDVFLVNYMVRNGFNATLGAGIRRETLDPLEEPLFRLPIADDPLCLPEALQSQVHVIEPRDRYSVGDKIRFRVDLYTKYGTRRHSGGDDVRVWLQSAVGNWSMVAAVTDLGDGSYQAEAVLKWSGVTLVKVSLAYPREYLRSLVEVFHTIHSLRWITNVYKRGNTTEKVVCFPFAPVPGFEKWCNLTSANGDRSWFCTPPVSEGLKCSDWSYTNNLPFLDVRRSPIHPAVQPFAAKLTQCMRNSTLLLLGDSNQRAWFDRILNLLPNCTKTYKGTASWHAFRKCQNEELNSTLMLGMHSMPFNVGKHGDLVNVPLPQALDHVLASSSSSSSSSSASSTSSSSKTVLVMHYYRHFEAYSVQVYRQRVREARRTLETWVQLHPEVTIFIRGAHAVYRNIHALNELTTGDAVAQLYAKVWREEFAGLRDRVRYLDTWDLTVAARNIENHPNNPQGNEMVKLLMGHMCRGDTD